MLKAVIRVREEVVPKVGTYALDKECQQAMYDIATELGLESKALFTALYHALIGKDQGPAGQLHEPPGLRGRPRGGHGAHRPQLRAHATA